VSAESGADADEPTATADTDPLDDHITESDTDDDEATDPLGGPAPVDDTDDGTDRAGAPLSDPVAVEDSAGKATDSADVDAAPARSVAVAVVTVGTGVEGVEDAVAAAFESAGHTVAVRERLRGDYDTVQQVVDRLVGRSDVDVVVTAGGVGIGADEATIEAVHPLLEKALPGFGEAFRSRLFEVIGTGIVAVRTTAGVADGTLVFCLPGDPEAAVVAVEEILVAEAPELVEYLDG
jgi:molybdenum cofactor biosynthesis protein B